MLGWLKGGHQERLAAAALMVVMAASAVAPPVRAANVVIDDAVLDLALTAFFGWMMLDGRRWWIMVMTAVMLLTLLVHGAMFLLPDLPPSADISARIGLGILVGFALLGGVVERWLAGEDAVCRIAPRAAKSSA